MDATLVFLENDVKDLRVTCRPLSSGDGFSLEISKWCADTIRVILPKDALMKLGNLITDALQGCYFKLQMKSEGNELDKAIEELKAIADRWPYPLEPEAMPDKEVVDG